MKTCINGATTMPYPLEKDVETAGKVGFDGIEIWREKLDQYLHKYRKEDLRDLIQSFRLGVSAICPFTGYVWCPENEFTKKLAETERYLKISTYIGCESLLVCAEESKSKRRKDVIETHVVRLKRLAQLAEDYGVKIELEWFSDLTDAIEIVNLVNHESLGMMIDTFHWYRGDGDITHIDLIPKDKLFLVHINDCENLPRERLTDENRLYCGLGVIPLVEILKRIKQKNYNGYLSVEIFRKEYWSKDPLTISLESLKTLVEVMEKATVRG
ncbi:MAG: sugar phosphate isomerase/epimerase [Candidatus Bathyarchaeia archaeon]